MILFGDITLYDTQYVLVLRSLKSRTDWFLYSKIHPSDYLKPANAHEHPVFQVTDLSKGKNNSSEYLVESLRVSFNNASGFYKNSRLLSEILNSYSDARSYGYAKNEIVDISREGTKSVLHCESLDVSINEVKVEGYLSFLAFRFKGMNIELGPISGVSVPKLEYSEISSNSELKSIALLDVNVVMFEMLESMIDLSWFRNPETGELYKNYSHVSSNKDFESKVIYPLVMEIMRCAKTGEECIIGFDTETDGLIFYYLSETNPILNKIVSAQVSWKDHQGVNIYLDMANFENANTNYVVPRLAELFRWERGEFEFTLRYDEEGNEINQTVVLNRDSYLVGGHNCPFDSRVMRRHGSEVFFDEDTLQMAFSVAPTSFKISKKLKAITKKLLKVEAPELVDILGKGNEDKFRYLVDDRVADLYGCADVDMFRLVWKKLKALMGPRMYKSYKRIDSYIINVLAEAEYYGCPADKKYILKNADIMEKDLEIIENFIYNLTGKLMLLQFAKDNKKKISPDQFEKAFYKFKISGKELLDVMYNQLKYPVKVYTDKGLPAVNSYAIDKLLQYKNNSPMELMGTDLMSSSGRDGHVLISKDVFNSYKYPLAYALKQYKVLTKEYTGYYKPLKEVDTEGRIFKGFKTANIETRRISHPIQTTKKDIKKCIIAFDKDWNMGDWDLSQVEARHFTSFGGDLNLIELMRDGDKDYHTENGSLIYNIPAHLLSKDDRKKAKAVGFGYPYGLSLFKMCERIFGVINQKTKLMTSEIIDAFERANSKAVEKLMTFRGKAREIVEISPELREFLELKPDAPVAMIHNENGFYRYQDMTNILGDNKKLASVERMFGNYPIQSFAADFFKILVTRLDKRLRKEGVKHKFIHHLTIHDELLFSFHKSLDPNFLIKIIKEECMVKIKGHTNYYLGINFGNNWYECKKDEAELPVKFVLRLCAGEYNLEPMDWCDSPADYYRPKILEFKKDRVVECVKEICDVNNKIINFDNLMESFANYTVRSYLYDIDMSYTPLSTGLDKKGRVVYDNDDRALSAVVTCLLEREMEDYKIVFNGRTYAIEDLISLKNDSAIDNDLNSLDLDLDDLFDDGVEETEEDFFSFNDDENASDLFFVVEDEIDEVIARGEELLSVVEDNFKYVETLGRSKILILDSYKTSNCIKLEQHVMKFKANKGFIVKIDAGGIVSTMPGLYNLPSDKELEKFLSELNKLDDRANTDSLSSMNVF